MATAKLPTIVWPIRLLIIACLLVGHSRQVGAFSDESIIAAFRQCHAGFSSDELLIRDDLRDCFVNSVAAGQPVTDRQLRGALLQLLKLRKAGKLDVKATRRGRPIDEAVLPVAEIAGRVVTDRHRITSDTMLADPAYRRELQREAELIVPGIDPYSVRKAVLVLRKKRALRPELVLQVADWNRTVTTQSLAELRRRLSRGEIPKRPGVYLFRDRNGYLYIGEAGDLAGRLAEHLAGSDRPSLAVYLSAGGTDEVTVELHLFPPDSPAAKTRVRRAYESELIRSREPRFNLRP